MRCAIVLAVIGMISAIAAGQTTRETSGLTPIEINLPKPPFIENPRLIPKQIEVPPKPVLMAPAGTTNLALKHPVDSSDRNPTIGELSLITDGDKEAIEGGYVELTPERQWVQIDLGTQREIWGVMIWHYFGRQLIYKDVIVQISDDAKFEREVTTLFNNDADGSSQLGAGKDREYLETWRGKLVQAKGQRARYVRLWSNGNMQDDLNQYVEVELYGR